MRAATTGALLLAGAWLALALAAGDPAAVPADVPVDTAAIPTAAASSLPCAAASPARCAVYPLPSPSQSPPAVPAVPAPAAARITARNVFRSFVPVGAATGSEGGKVRLPGHVITLEADAAAHFSVLPPATGCGSGVGAPVDVTARAYAKHRHHLLRVACDAASPSAACRAGAWGAVRASTAAGSAAAGGIRQRLWVTSSVRGCRVATNAGLFNTTDWGCHGSLVSDGARLPSRHRRLPYFGIAAGAAVVGYLDEGDVAAAFDSVPTHASTSTRSRDAVEGALNLRDTPLRSGGAAAQLVAGLVWLVRDGASYVAGGEPARFEDGSAQESGTLDRFIRVSSGRTLVGVTHDARVVIAQVDGRSDWLGLDLATFAAWGADSLNLAAAINLDGGASSTFVRGGVTANVPTYNCHMPGASYDTTGRARRRAAESDLPPRDDDPNFRCKRPVASVLCLHDDPPAPAVNASSGRLVVTHGCVCFQLRPDGSAARAAMSGDHRFGVDDVLAVVQLGSPATGAGAGRRLARRALQPLDAVLAAAGGPLPPRQPAQGRRLTADAPTPMCLCTPDAAAAAGAATAGGTRDTGFESGLESDGARASRGADDDEPPLFELYHLSRVPPPPPSAWGGTVEAAFSVDDVLDWPPLPPLAPGGDNTSQPCTDVAALAHVLPLCLPAMYRASGGSGALDGGTTLVSTPVIILALSLLAGLGAWYANSLVRRRLRGAAAGGTAYEAVPPTDVPSAAAADADADDDADAGTSAGMVRRTPPALP